MAKEQDKKYRVFSQHQRSNIELPKMTLRDVRGLALAAAELRTDSFYRAFEITESGDLRFATAFSVLDGKVREHKEVTIPAEHW